MESLFDDVEASQFFERHYSLLVNESDMGCVLIGVSAIDQQLELLFKGMLPEDANSKIKKRIFDGRGVFGDLSSKLDVAYTCRLIPKDIYESVNVLRKLRNKIAHDVMTFELMNHLDSIYEVFSKVDGNLLGLMMKSSQKIIADQVLSEAMSVENPVEDGEKWFRDSSEAIDFIMGDSTVLSKMNTHRMRVAFIIGLCFIGARVVIHKNNAIK